VLHSFFGLEKSFPRRWRDLFVIAITALAVAGCSSSNDDSDDPGDGDGGGTAFERGVLLQQPPVLVAKITAADLLGDTGDPLQQALLAQAGTPAGDLGIKRVE
jgi:hypothetical protein